MKNVAVVGYGYWGPNILRVLMSNDSVRVKYLCELDSSKLSLAKAKYPDLSFTRDFDTVLNDSEIDAVFIVTPIFSHYELAKKALQKGKDVFVEKPLTGSAETTEDLIKIAEKNEKILMVGHTFEFSPPVMETKKIIDSGDLGDIYFITSSRVNLGIHRKDMSVIWDLAPHDFSMMFSWLDESPSEILTLGRDSIFKGNLDIAFMNIKFPSGIIANVEVSWLSPVKMRKTVIVGSKKMLVYDDTESVEKIKIYDKGVDFKEPEDFGEYQLTYRSGSIISPKLPNKEPLKIEIAHFIDCITNRTTPKTDGYSALRVIKAIEAAEKSAQEGKYIKI
ncbi:Gfo/Idh/MocA family oxidoreductase [candidate division WOR-3 bacterium]|nr:Gfo/Idh/MocA family oxidoreductase [candidate division WOR-3 bacterium]